MPEIARLVGCISCFGLDFVEREATPELAMKLGIQLHFSLLNIGVQLYLAGL
jgi:hypothetical protein